MSLYTIFNEAVALLIGLKNISLSITLQAIKLAPQEIFYDKCVNQHAP
jgi:hypothetical protein